MWRRNVIYHYPSINLIKSIEKEFGVEYPIEDHVEDIGGDLINHGLIIINSKIFTKKINIVENPINSQR